MDHIPVLLTSVLEVSLEATLPKRHCHVLDCTFGRGGYSKAFLQAGHKVTAIDRDHDAINVALALHAEYGDNFQFIQDKFSNISTLFPQQNFDVIVFDIGVSSPQLDQAERGFSFNKSGPLDMRMGSSTLTAADIINHYSEENLANIFFKYGEEKRSRKFARLICQRRLEHPFETTQDLASLIADNTPKFFNKKKKIHPATLVFQALRIAVNDELNEFETALNACQDLLKPEGRLITVTFHSLEDRIAKSYFKMHSFEPKQSKYAKERIKPDNLFRLITKKPITASIEEIKHNPRSSCAKLRSAIRTDFIKSK